MNTYFLSLSGLATLNVLLTEFVNSTLNISKKWLKQLISWLIPVLISIVGLVCGLGMFADYGTITSVAAWIYTIATGFGVGLMSNGIYKIEFIEQALETLKTIKLNK